MSVRENIIYYIKKNIFIVLVLIGLCPVLALSYAKFTINSESYRSNEMYISELLYSIKIDGNNVYSVDIESGETEHTIEITSLSGISSNYKLAYLNNDNLEVRYASDYMDASFGGIIMTRTISLTIKNASTEKQTLSLMVFGGYSFNDVEEVKVLDTYTEIDTNYLHYDYETTALYIDNTRVDSLDTSKNYTLVSYTCSNDVTVEYNSDTRKIIVDGDKQTKCSLYFEEKKVTLANYLIDNYSTLGLTKIDQTATGNQNYAATEYRYQGKTPNNYITFNGEQNVWRIIGVLEVETPNGTGYTKEYKVKIVRDAIGKAAWDYKTSSGWNNDWTTSTLMTMLNSGPYYNRTSGYTQLACSTGYDTTTSETAICNYESNGLTENAKNQISSTKWYLGSVTYGTSSKDCQGTYQEERSTSVHSGNSQTWDGKVALIYPSDYMYASSSCYNNGTTGDNYEDSSCTSTNWLLGTSYWSWAVSPSSSTSNYAMGVYVNGTVSYRTTYYSSGSLLPSTYLDTNINYVGGSGTTSDPFVIK